MVDDAGVEERVSSTLARLTTAQKAALRAGQDTWSTVPVDDPPVPSLRLTDGPNGVRGFDDQHGTRSTSFPVGAALGATCAPELVRRVGVALAQEAAAVGASLLLGPTMNIPRVPNAGRNFECFSEDPWLSGVLAAAYVQGVQSQGVAACVKHVVCNDQETDRYTIDVEVSQRALHEVYLEPFRIAVARARPWAAMSAYNTVGGTTASEHPLLREVLRDDWGFDGLVVSDWYGTSSHGAVTSGLDLEMPGPARWVTPAAVLAALADGSYTEAELDRSVANLLRLVERTGGTVRTEPSGALPERPAVRALAREVASAATVLLRNDGTLPLAAPQRIAVIGEHAATTPHQGGGSSSVRAHRTVSVLDGLRAGAAPGTEVTWSRGCATWRRPPLLDPSTLSWEAHGDGLGAGAGAGAGGGLRAVYRDRDGAVLRTEVLARTFAGWFGSEQDGFDHESFTLEVSGSWTPLADARQRLSVEVIGACELEVDGRPVLRVDSDGPAPTSGQHDLDVVGGRPVELRMTYRSVAGGWRHVRLGAHTLREQDPVAEAVRAAAAADVAVVVVGLSDEWETEGEDRPDLRLPGEQDRLVAAVAAVQPRTVVVVVAGAPVELPWVDDVAAVVHAWYGGQEVGHALADVLLGLAEPSGRLPVVWPDGSDQHPALTTFPGHGGRIVYAEGVYVGQRAYDRDGLEPLFELGHGGSYTTFGLGSATASVELDRVVLEVEVANTGERAGVEVLHVEALGIGGIVRRRCGVARVELEAGASAPARMEVLLEDLACWDPDLVRRVLPSGELRLAVRGLGGRVDVVCQLPAA